MLNLAEYRNLVAVASRLNNAFRRLGSGWAIFVEAQRHEAAIYPASRFGDAASALVDAERKADFEEAGAHYESSYFLTFLYLPPVEDAARAESWLYEGREHGGVDPHEILSAFVDRTDRVLQFVEGFMPECRWLDDSETLTFLHSTVSTKRHRVRVPETPIYLDALLADQPLTGGLEPRLGDEHLRILTIVGFPTATTPGILDELNRLAFPYRWSTRAILLDKTDATKLLTKIRRQWFAKRKSIAAILKEVMTNEQSVLVDTDAANKAADADLALQELGADYAGQAYVTASVTVWDADPRTADEKLRLVEKVIQGRDFTCMAESINAADAWLGGLPGHAYANVRQPPISTLNLAHMIPLSAVWAGPERDEHFGAPPLLYGRTEGSTPFRFSLHVGDVGHTLVVGPTGSGKSVLLACMALQFRRYAQSQVFAFDFGGSIRAAALAMGGDWHDLGGGLTEGAETSVSLQPLARIHETHERAWAADWIAAILMRESVAITPDVKEHLWTALTSLASAPAEERTITGLAVLLQSNDLKQALRPYCVGGPYGRLLDAESEHLGHATVQAFETEGLIGSGAAPAVLAYLFHRIGDRLDGRPTLLIVDEGWLALDDEGFSGQLREWLKTLRKKNASVIFATQSLSDIDGSSIAPAIIESCPTRLLLLNERAIEPQITSIYRRFGLNDRQIEILARATPKRDYYCQSRRGNRLFDLGLSEVALALCAASSKADQIAIHTMFAEHGRDGFINSMQVYPFTQGALYQVYTAVGQITDIALQPGENLVGTGPVAAGDTVRWIIGDTESGTGSTRQIHILVKPTRPGLTTNLVINTDRRTYHMELRSTERTYMASVSWQYPQDQLIALRRQNTEAETQRPVATGVDLANVNFRYAIEGDRAPWRPQRAFDDGRQVFIEFPRGIGQGEMPPLFIVGPEGDTSELVNYRVSGRYMIVDRLFAAAELRLGADRNQRRVRIVRTDGRPS